MKTGKLKAILFLIVISIFLFVLTEGFLSTLIVLRDFSIPIKGELRRLHAHYDQFLGWVNIPNLEIKDYYRPGANLKINSQGFRNNKDFSIDIPKGKIRIICSGDSFTFGTCVDNKYPWCERLTSLDKKIESINIGQEGYGVDQSYIWYMRAGRKFKHNIQIFSFITDDFYRMFRDYYGNKPKLKLNNNKLVIYNVPVLKFSYLSPELAEHLSRLNKLRILEFLQRIKIKFRLADKNESVKDNEEIQKIILKTFDNLQAVNKEQGSTLILVYLAEYQEGTKNDSKFLRKWLQEELAKRGILFIDLFEEFDNLKLAEINSFFIENDEHYSEKGNQFVAKVLYKKLVSYGLLN